MSNNNDSGKFFKFKNLQLVRKQNPARQTRQNTDIRMQGTAEEQFAAITAAARVDALREIDNLSSDDESVDYCRLNNNPWNHKFKSEITVSRFPIWMKLTIVCLEVLQTVHWTLRV